MIPTIITGFPADPVGWLESIAEELRDPVLRRQIEVGYALTAGDDSPDVWTMLAAVIHAAREADPAAMRAAVDKILDALQGGGQPS